MRILKAHDHQYVRKILRELRVDSYGVQIMSPKSLAYLIKMNSLTNIAANILKQEMLSLGGDAAVSRDALTGRARKTDCLLMGNLSQFLRLDQKLKKQPFGLKDIGRDLRLSLNNYQKEKFSLDLGRFKLSLGERTRIMGIINLTPDSFSGDGLYKRTVHSASLDCARDKRCTVDKVIAYAEQLIEDGADIIDLGGESSRPQAKPVSLKDELKRIIPAVKLLARKIKIPISVDTYKPEVARQALDNGAVIVNDITGLREDKMRKVIARYKAAAIVMHMKGNPRTMQKNPLYLSLLDEIIGFLDAAVRRAQDSGIDRDRLIVDPGIGFGKTLEHNLEILNHLDELKVLGRPITVGVSRKSFIGKILGVPAQERVAGTISSCVLAATKGAQILRVHDVKPVKEALKVLDAIKR